MILVLCIGDESDRGLTLCEPRQYQSTVTIVPPLDILQKESDGPLGTLNNSLLRQVMDTTAGGIAKMYGERPANPSFHRGCSAILCPPIKEVQYGTEDIEVVESPGPVLAEAGSAMAEIGCDAESVLPRTRSLGRGVSLVAAEAGAPASRGSIPRKSCPPRPYRPSPRSGSPRAVRRRPLMPMRSSSPIAPKCDCDRTSMPRLSPRWCLCWGPHADLGADGSDLCLCAPHGYAARL